MKVKLTKLGVLLIPLSTIPSECWKNVRTIIGESALFNNYQLEGPGGLTMGHVSQDSVSDGEYDLPLTSQDFMEAYGL